MTQAQLDSAASDATTAETDWQTALTTHSSAVVDALSVLLAAAKTRNDAVGDAGSVIGSLEVDGLATPANVTTARGVKTVGPVDYFQLRAPEAVKADVLVGEIVTAAYRKAGLAPGNGYAVGHNGSEIVTTLTHRFAHQTPRYVE